MVELKEIGKKEQIQILRTIDKADRMEPLDLFNLLTVGRRDGSGDFSEGVGLHPWQATMMLRATILNKVDFRTGQRLYDHIEARFAYIDSLDNDDFHAMMDEFDARPQPKDLAEFIDDHIANHQG